MISRWHPGNLAMMDSLFAIKGLAAGGAAGSAAGGAAASATGMV